MCGLCCGVCSSVLVIIDGVLVAVVLSVWILVSSALDSNCVVVEEFLLWELDLDDVDCWLLMGV